MSVDDVVGRCRVVPKGYPTGKWAVAAVPWQRRGSLHVPRPAACLKAPWLPPDAGNCLLSLPPPLVWCPRCCPCPFPKPPRQPAPVSTLPHLTPLPHPPPRTPSALVAAIDTFECAATFTRKGKKFSDPPELAIPEDLQDCQPAAAANKGGCRRCSPGPPLCSPARACEGGWHTGVQDRRAAAPLLQGVCGQALCC